MTTRATGMERFMASLARLMNVPTRKDLRATPSIAPITAPFETCTRLITRIAMATQAIIPTGRATIIPNRGTAVLDGTMDGSHDRPLKARRISHAG
ncbi:hypothetical protein CWO90_08640 [Bradyrhizobium sp. Leo121]|nr:hypothetical protein CWO90_08640 [Bradyrhizobium sp. Leo121]